VLLPVAALLPLGTIGFSLGPDPGAAIMMVLYPVVGMICIHLLVAERRILKNLRLAPMTVEGRA
jgi:hypothetical protein